MAIFAYTLFPQKEARVERKPIAFLGEDPTWADQYIAQLSRKEKIAQLINLKFRPEDPLPESDWLTKWKVGGLLFEGFSADSLEPMFGLTDSLPIIPPLMGISKTQVGLDHFYLPTHPGLGQVRPDSLLLMAAKGTAQQLKDWGGHYLIQPAPPQHFSEDNLEDFVGVFSQINQAVQEKQLMYVLGDGEIYFPRMRDTLKRDSLTSIYRQMGKNGLSGLALSPAELDKVHPGSYRNSLIRTAAKQKLDFDGLIMVPCPDSVGDYDNWAELFIKSGADMLLVNPDRLNIVFDALEFALLSNKWSYEDLNARLKRVLLAKTWVGIPPYKEDPQPSFLPDYDFSARRVNQQLEKASLTLIRSRDKLLPLRDLKNAAVHLVSVGEPMPELLRQMRFYGPVSQSHIELQRDGSLPPIKISKYRRYEPIIFAFNMGKIDATKHEAFLSSLEELSQKEQILILNIGSLDNLSIFSSYGNLMHAYHNEEFSQRLVAQALFGGVELRGVLPIEINEDLVYGLGVNSKKSRLGFALPEEVGMDDNMLARIDTIVYEGLQNLAMPGCQVLVAKGGQIIYNKAFGYHTYARRRKVLHTDLYDIASITKVAATTLASMKMMDQRKIRLNDRLGRFFKNEKVIMDSVAFSDTSLYVRPRLADTVSLDSAPAIAIVPVVQRSNPHVITDSLKISPDSVLVIQTIIGGKSIQDSRIFDVRIKDLLTHHSGLPAGLPIREYISYWRRGYGRYGKYFSPGRDSRHNVEVASRFYLRRDYLDSLWEKTKAIELDPVRDYRYSDANFVLLQQAIDSINHYPIDSFLRDKIYEPMGLQHLGFNPRKRFRRDRLIPTERDRWRNQLLRGYVHDPTAALLGGVSGNAGLFSNAEDLAHLFQMLLQGGWYGEERFINKQTIANFTQIQKGDRGYGFDMVGNQGNSFAAYRAPKGTFGHTGFTGTCVWVDPYNELIYIFLSNRNHPRSNNWTLNELAIRQRIHEAIYLAMREEARNSFVELER